MTFTEMQTEILSRLNLSSTESTTRIASAINRHYRRVTIQCGLELGRFTTISVNTSAGTRTITATEIEKADRVIDGTTASSIRVLEEVSLDYIRKFQTSSGRPTKWAHMNTDADSVVIIFDFTPDATYAMKVDGWATVSALSGANEGVIPESYHDIITWGVLAEEFARKEKMDQSLFYEAKSKELLSQLKFHLADTQITTRQANEPGGRRFDVDTGIY